MRVGLGVHFDGEGLFGDDGVFVAIDGGVNANGEEMLVVLGESAWGDNIAVGRSLAFVDVHHGNDASRASLDCDAMYCQR